MSQTRQSRDLRSVIRPFTIPAFGGFFLKDVTKERWRELCEQAENEQDVHKLIELAEEINRLLKEKEDRLKNPAL